MSWFMELEIQILVQFWLHGFIHICSHAVILSSFYTCNCLLEMFFFMQELLLTDFAMTRNCEVNMLQYNSNDIDTVRSKQFLAWILCGEENDQNDCMKPFVILKYRGEKREAMVMIQFKKLLYIYAAFV